MSLKRRRATQPSHQSRCGSCRSKAFFECLHLFNNHKARMLGMRERRMHHHAKGQRGLLPRSVALRQARATTHHESGNVKDDHAHGSAASANHNGGSSEKRSASQPAKVESESHGAAHTMADHPRLETKQRVSSAVANLESRKRKRAKSSADDSLMSPKGFKHSQLTTSPHAEKHDSMSPMPRKESPEKLIKHSRTPRLPSSWPAKVGKPAIQGLNNPGQWCYRRSVLQSLLCLSDLYRLLEQHGKCSGACLTCEMSDLATSYHGNANVRRQVSQLDRVIATTGKRSDPAWRHSGQSQEDAHMFMQYLLANMEQAKGMSKRDFRHFVTIEHQTTWTCGVCSKVHHHTDPRSYSLQLPIHAPANSAVSVQTCLDKYHTEQDLTIRCDGCKSNRPRTRYHKVKDAPNVLIVQLKRFGFNQHGRGGAQKNSRRVRVDAELDMTPWCVAAKRPVQTQYRLQAVVAHSGRLNMGHYVAYVRTADGIRLVNDESVSRVSDVEWRSPRTYDPYILVYTRI